MTKWTKKQFVKIYVDHLRALANGEVEPHDTGSGLCAELRWFRKSELYSPQAADTLPIDFLMGDLQRTWYLFSGNYAHPVPRNRRERGPILAETTYRYAGNKWLNDEYGDLRRELCDHLADMLESMEVCDD